MSTSISAWVLQDHKRAMFNDLIRLKTPNDDSPEECKWQESIHKCIWSNPLTVVEGLGLVLSGIITLPSQVIGVRGLLTTQHQHKSVTAENFTLDLQCPPLPPFCYQDHSVTHSLRDNHSWWQTSKNTKGWSCVARLGPQEIFKGSLPRTTMTSTITSSDCLCAGISSVQRALCDMACCPLGMLCSLCCMGCTGTYQILGNQDGAPEQKTMDNV